MAADDKFAESLDDLAVRHQKRLVAALKTLEERIADLLSGAPVNDGQLFDLEWAIAARKQIRQAIEEEYLAEVDAIVRTYPAVADRSLAMINKFGDFTKVDRAIIRQLQTQTFQGFETIANRFADEIATELYQNTITGRPINDSIRNIRQKINGVYIESEDEEAQRLVRIAQAGGARGEEAVKKLQSLYGRDRAGNNLRKYSGQIAHDSLMQFDANIVVSAGREAGVDEWKYYGDTVNDSREWCREHAGKVYTTAEIYELWNNNEWAGKAPGDPFAVRGGYNCGHHWRPYISEDA